MAIASQTRLVRLRDGRYMCLVDAGDPQGPPVFYFHGGPGSRIGGLVFAEVAARHGLRLLSADRPGMGFSDLKRGRQVKDWVEDVEDMAQALDIESFAVFGASGGGPYALACARFLPERLTAAVVGSGIGPVVDEPAILATFPRPVRMLLTLARLNNVVLRLAVKLMTKESKSREGENKFTAVMVGDRPRSDHEIMQMLRSMPEIQSENAEVMRQGVRGGAEDLACVAARPWGFDVRDIAYPVRFFHGADDTAVPVASAQILSSLVPEATLTVLEGGHNVILADQEAVFEPLSLARGAR